MFKVTPQAAEQIRKAARESDAENMALRIAARVMPDGGIDYNMGFDDPGADDVSMAFDGINIIIAEEAEDLLKTTTLDYVELQAGQLEFVFLDPGNPRHTADPAEIH